MASDKYGLIFDTVLSLLSSDFLKPSYPVYVFLYSNPLSDIKHATTISHGLVRNAFV